MAAAASWAEKPRKRVFPSFFALKKVSAAPPGAKI